MNTVLRALVATGLMAASSQSLAAAFQLAEQNVSGLGRAYAGEASAADDASVVARNPALMGQFEGVQVSAAAMYVEPDVSLEGTSTNNGLPANLLDDNSIAPSAVVPAVFMTARLNEQWSVGAGIYSQFGLATEFDKDYVAGQLAGETEIVTINTGVSVAYEIDAQWTLALGLNHVYADAKVIRHLGANPLQAPASTEVVNLEGDDSGYGWNLGLSYQIDADNRLGFHYRSETDITFDGHFSNQIPAALGGTNGVALAGTLELTLPAMAEISGTHKLTEPMTLHYSVLWTGWNSFQELEAQVAGKPVFNKQELFDNSLRFSVGGDYQWNESLKLRAGLAYDSSPANELHMSISIPDTDRTWYSFGAEYRLSDAASIDLGLSILRGKTQTFVEKDSLGSEWGFKSKGHATVLGVQYNHSF